MERELLSLALFLLAAVIGVARFRTHPRLDDFSFLSMKALLYLGTLLLAVSLIGDGWTAALVPLSLLVLLHTIAFFYKNRRVEIFGLPIVIVEMLLALHFSDVSDHMSSPIILLSAWIFHTAFVALGLKLLLQAPLVPPLHGKT